MGVQVKAEYRYEYYVLNGNLECENCDLHNLLCHRPILTSLNCPQSSQRRLNMAPSKAPYDPVVSVEAMYKDSVSQGKPFNLQKTEADRLSQLTRLGYFFKDPKLYGDATLAVLRKTAKPYDDALDDCLIQIVCHASPTVQ